MQSPHKKSFAAEQLRQRQKKSPVTIVIIVLAVVIAVGAVGYALYVRFGEKEIPVTETVAPPAKEIKSIAVLPLDNQSGDPEQEYFTDGMHDALINNLYKISALRVIPRTSVMRYRDTDKTISEIAKELEVDAVIEGSVLRVENKVRITVQLVGAEPERHLWANDYTRDLSDIIALQNEVAQAIAVEIKITVTPEEEKRLVSSYTVNPEAYDYYLRGNYYRKRSYREEDIQIAIQMYQKAIDLDPEFALAYTGISRCHIEMWWFYYDRTQKRLDKAKESADKALQLNPELPEAHQAMGNYYSWGDMVDYDHAFEHYNIALKIQPNNSDILAGIGYTLRIQGKFEQALANIKKAFELDPLSDILALEVGFTFTLIRNYQDAERYYNRAISLAPDNPGHYSRKAWLYIHWEGNIEKARTVLDKSPLNVDSAENPFINTFITLDLYDGNYQKALDRLSLISEDTDYHNALRYAQIYRYINKKELAQAYCDSARIILEKKIQGNYEDDRFHSSLGIAYAGLGRKEEAIREGKLGVALLPVSKEAWTGLYRVEDLARIYVLVGEYDNAIDQLEFLLSRPGEMTIHLLRLDPIWEPLREHPRFKALLKKMGLE